MKIGSDKVIKMKRQVTRYVFCMVCRRGCSTMKCFPMRSHCISHWKGEQCTCIPPHQLYQISCSSRLLTALLSSSHEERLQGECKRYHCSSSPCNRKKIDLGDWSANHTVYCGNRIIQHTVAIGPYSILSQ